MQRLSTRHQVHAARIGWQLFCRCQHVADIWAPHRVAELAFRAVAAYHRSKELGQCYGHLPAARCHVKGQATASQGLAPKGHYAAVQVLGVDWSIDGISRCLQIEQFRSELPVRR